MVGITQERRRRRVLFVLLPLAAAVALGVVTMVLSRPRNPTGWTPAPALTFEATPSPQTDVARVDDAIAVLERVVREHASDPANAWALIHGILAEGPEFQTADGQVAIDFLYGSVAEPAPENSAGMPLPAFPTHRFCEPHVDLMLKGILESGVPLDRQISGTWGSGTLVNHILATQLRFDFDPERGPLSIQHPDDLPWTLQALATVTAAEAPTWRNQGGKTIDLNQVTDWAATRLTAEDATLAEAQASGQLPVRDGKAIFSYTCGGSHLYQGVAYAVGRGFGSRSARQAIEDATELLFWRLRAEVQVYDLVGQSRPPGLSELDLAIQRFKFLGHWNESIHKSLILGLFVPTPQQQGDLRLGLALLVDSLEKLEALGAFDQIQALRAQGSPRALDNYFNLIGDGTHALRALRLATGQGKLGH